MRGRRVTRLIVVLVAMTAVGACSSSADSSIKSSTPRLKSSAARLEPGLLRQRQIEGIPGLEGLTKRRLDDTSAFENPDPRGPCGAVVPELKMSDGAIRVFATGNGSQVFFSSIVPMGEPKAKAYMDAMVADAYPGCSPFHSTTNTGRTQEIDPTVVTLPPIADQQVGELGKVSVGGVTGHIAGVIFRQGGLVVSAQYLGADPLDAETLGVLAQQSAVAAQRLGAANPAT